MARGNITRITGGKNSIETDEWIVYTDKFSAYAGKGSHFTANEGTVFGNPKEVDAGDYFKKGWWSSDYEGNKKITLAELDDVVYFQVELTDYFPSKNKNLSENERKKIHFKIYKFDGYDSKLYGIYPLYTMLNELKKEKKQELVTFTYTDSNDNKKMDEEEKHTERPYDEIEARGNRATLSIHLNKALQSLFINNYDFGFFLEVSYDGETLELPEEENFLTVMPKVKEIYVKLLNYRIPSKANIALNEINASQQFIRGNDDKQSQKVNMDYFSVRIEKLPPLTGGIMTLYKFLMQNFVTLASGTQYFEGNGPVPQSIDYFSTVNGKWEFIPYPKEDDEGYAKEQERKWNYEINHPIFYIEADTDDYSAKLIVDHGAVIVSEFDEMCWLFTTINTEKSKTQPFSGHRQFGIHQDEEGYYRVFARAIDRIWPDDTTFGPKTANFFDMDATVKDYLAIADGTWTWYMNIISRWITMLGGEVKIMKPEIIRTDFHKFFEKYNGEHVTHIGNIPQYKDYEK